MKIFEILDFKFNSEELKQTYLNNNNEWAKYGKGEKFALHTQYTSMDHPIILKHIEQIKNFKNLIENVKFFKTLKNAGVGPHRDKRKVAINIPVIVDENSCVTFYESDKEIGSVDPILVSRPNEIEHLTGDSSKAKYYSIEEARLIGNFRSQNVFCIDTSQIHGVSNKSNNDRVILSISFKPQYDNFNIIKRMYENGELL
jgi:hypothetical protein